jgi:hypothetical protein
MMKKSHCGKIMGLSSSAQVIIGFEVTEDLCKKMGLTFEQLEEGECSSEQLCGLDSFECEGNLYIGESVAECSLRGNRVDIISIVPSDWVMSFVARYGVGCERFLLYYTY